MVYELLTIHRDGPLVTVTMDRPKQLNALSLALEDEMRRCFRALSADDDVRAIILTGAGRAFSAGVDLTELSADPAAKDHRIWHGPRVNDCSRNDSLCGHFPRDDGFGRCRSAPRFPTGSTGPSLPALRARPSQLLRSANRGSDDS